MLIQLLDVLQAGGTYRVADLAETLDTTPQLVEIMLADLVRLSYLEPVKGNGGCQGCPSSRTCTVNTCGGIRGMGRSRLWRLTDKGWHVDRDALEDTVK